MDDFLPSKELLEFIVDRINVGVFILDESMKVQFWNKFMASNSGINASDVVGKNLFEAFPQLPQRWLQRKVKSLFQFGDRFFRIGGQIHSLGEPFQSSSFFLHCSGHIVP